MLASVIPEPPPVAAVLLERAARPGRVRGIALDIAGLVARNPRTAGPVLQRELRAARALHSRERRFVADGLYDGFKMGLVLQEVLKTREMLAQWLGWLVYRGLDPDIARDAWSEEGHRTPVAFGTARNLRRSAAASFDGLPREAALGIAAGVNADGARALAAVDDVVAFLRASNQRAPVVLRVNGRRASREDWLERLRAHGVPCEPTPLSRHGIAVRQRVATHELPGWREGILEVQDEGSQLLAEWVEPTGLVIDLCAGAGGKTLALAALSGEHQLVACDIRRDALRELRRRARRSGANVDVMELGSAGEWPDALRGLRASRVLVDAPCTGSGTWRRHPHLRYSLSRRCELAALQRELLGRASTLVARGGRLVYATCSVLPMENDDVVTAFLAQHSDFHPIKPTSMTTAGRSDSPYLRLLPHQHGTDGFFAAVLERTG